MLSRSKLSLVALSLALASFLAVGYGEGYHLQRMSYEEGQKWFDQVGAIRHSEPAQLRRSVETTALPTNFDGREQWPGCIHSVLNQGACGSCWSFAASEVLSDRFCINSNGSVNVTLSPQYLLSCEFWNAGCAMGSPPNFAWDYLVDSGIPVNECVAYRSGNGHNYSCPKHCDDGSALKLYKAKSKKHVGSYLDASSHVTEIMKAVMQGPVDATFNVWGDFSSYSGGVYEHKSGGYDGLHSVKVIGFGEDGPQKTPYWLVQNSWGPYWGPYHGFFKIKRGVNECLFESAMFTGEPLL